MTEKQILFSSEMVRAILEGRKIQTRRVIKPQPPKVCKIAEYFPEMKKPWWIGSDLGWKFCYEYICPYGRIGDQLWVRESFQLWEPWGSADDEWIGDDLMEIDGRLSKEKPQMLIDGWWHIAYKADEPELCSWWRPSIFMPRWASRITLEIVKIGVERLQDISLEDVKAEGVHSFTFARGALSEKPPDPRWKFIEQWDSLNAERGFGWDINPWVWVIAFKRMLETMA